MRITIPVLALEKGGGVRYLLALAEGLSAIGHDVQFVVPQLAPQHWETKVRVMRVTALSPQTIPESDVLIPNFYPTVAPAIASGKGRVLRLSLGYEPLWVAAKEEAKASYQLNIPIVTISPHLHDIIFNDIGKSSIIIPPGIDPSIFFPDLNVIHKSKTIFYVYRAPSHGYTYKGQHDFWHSLRMLVSKYSDIQPVLVTPEPAFVDPPIPCRIMAMVSDEELAQLYRSADVLISTSRVEAFGLSPLEAMACGTPVVTVECGGIHAYVQPGINAMVVPPRRPELLAHTIERVLTDHALRTFLVAHGLRTAVRFTWQQTIDEFQQVLVALSRGYLDIPQ